MLADCVFSHSFSTKHTSGVQAATVVLGQYRVKWGRWRAGGVICSLAGGAHFLVCGHWALAAVHQYGSL